MRYSAPNLRHLRSLSAVAEFKTISAASHEIFLSQPAITQAISKLEKEQQVSFFDRRPDGMYLTEAGHLFVDRINRMLRYIRSGAKKASDQLGKKASKDLSMLEQLLTGVQLRALIALSDINNYSLAAKSIDISQPSLHRAAKDLEHICGAVLFEKESRGIKLTDVAEILAFHFRMALAELDQGIDELAAWRGQDSSEIKIGAMPLSRTYILPQAVNHLMIDKPKLNIKIEDGPYSILLQGLRNGRLDFLIGALRNPVPAEDVKQEFLFDDELEILCSYDHPLRDRADITLDDLAQYGWVVPTKATPTREFFDQLFNDFGNLNLIESSSLVMVRGLLASSERLTIISRHQAHYELQTNILSRVSFKLHNTNRAIGLHTRKDWRPTATQAALLKNIRQVAEDMFFE